MAGILTAVGLFSQHGMNNMLIANSAYGLATLIAGLPILTKAISALQAWVMSIELLVSIAVVGAVAILELEEAAMVTFLFVLGNLLEQRTLQRTHRAIQNLTEMQPTTATIVVNGQQQVVEIDDVEEGAVLVVRVGDQVPVDGQIISGEAEIDEALITGESKLVEKTSGDQAYMGSIVEEAQDNQAPMSKMIDRFAKYYTPFVLVLAILIFAITRNLRLAITILVLACPGALVIGAPVSNVAGIGRGAKAGILIKGGSVIDQLSQVDTILFDKTGTVTEGRPTVKSIKEYQGDGWLKLAASLEKQTNHPLARSIVEYYEKRTQTVIDDIQIPITTVKGTGIQSKYQGETIWIGSQRILTNQPIELTAQQKTDLQTIEEEGQSVVLMTADNQLVLMIGLIDQVRPDVKSTFEKLKQNGIVQQWMLTGDHTVIAKKVARSIGIEQVKAQMLPEDKAQFLEQLQKQGHYVLFVGDGINDSPSIAKANVGIAMGSGTDVAIETSDVVLIDSEFSNIQNARRIAKATMRNTMQNVSIAIGTVMLLLIGVVYGWVNMASGMLFHEVSILIVIFNAMRLLRMKF